MASKINPVGAEFQVNSNVGGGNGTANPQTLPSIATLGDGRFAIVYQSQFDVAATDDDIHYVFINANGTASPAASVYGPSGLQTQPVTAGRLDGGFGAAWTDALTAAGGSDANPN